jgi:dienelactone hydrolase
MLRRESAWHGEPLMTFAGGICLSRFAGSIAETLFARMLTVMALAVMVLAVSAVTGTSRAAEREFGGFGPEGSRMHEQLWILPSGEEGRSLRATVFRPDTDASAPNKKFPLVVINHGTDESTRLAVAMPVYYWLSRWFVERGYIVVLPQRRGHGATGGVLSESVGTCEHPNHYVSGNIAADDIAATINYMTTQPFVAQRGTIVAGISTGGWASLAIAARNLPQVQAIVNFAGGRGGHAYGQPNAICGTPDLLAAARMYGDKAREPTIWFYAKNDSYFGPDLAQNLARAWSSGGGSVEEHILAPYSSEGHTIADDRQGWDLWGPSLDRFLTSVRGGAVEVAAEHTAQPPSTLETSAMATTGATR